MLRLLFKWGILFIIFFMAALMVLLSNADPSAEYNTIHPSTSQNTATIIMVDGLSQDIFEAEIKKGNLPNIENLIPRSYYIKNGIGSFPSMTGYAFYPFITGEDAVESGIYGLRWFDRSLDAGNLRNYVGRTNIQMNVDISQNIQNAFEIYHQYYTASINTYMNRGVHHSLKTGWAHTTAKYSQNSIFPYMRSIPFIGDNMAKNHFEHETLVTDLAIDQLKKNPKVQWITYPSPDAHNHVHGTDEIYYSLLHHIDAQIGRILNSCEELGQNDRMIAIVTDHGISDVYQNLDIVDLFDKELNLDLERGPSTQLNSDQLDAPIDEFIFKDGYFVINGNLSAYLYMKDPDSNGKDAWRNKTPWQRLENYRGKHIPSFIAGLKGIDLVAYALDSTSVKILKDDKEVIFKQIGFDRFQYNYPDKDPLSYDLQLQPDTIYSARQILENTYLTSYPYAPVRLFNLLTKIDGPDLVMTSLPGYDLASDYEIFVSNYKGGHGGIRSELLRVPYILFQPRQKGMVDSTGLAEEVGQIILDYLSNGSDTY